MIYQLVNKRTEILPSATSHKAHLCNQFNHVCTPNFYATLSVNFFQNNPTIKLFLQKHDKFFKRWGLRSQDPVPPAAGGFAPRSQRQHPIANFWLRA